MPNNNTATEQMVTLVLPVSKVNVVLAGLAELPFRISNQLIAEVEHQATNDIERQRAFMNEPKTGTKGETGFRSGEAPKFDGSNQGAKPGPLPMPERGD